MMGYCIYTEHREEEGQGVQQFIFAIEPHSGLIGPFYVRRFSSAHLWSATESSVFSYLLVKWSLFGTYWTSDQLWRSELFCWRSLIWKMIIRLQLQCSTRCRLFRATFWFSKDQFSLDYSFKLLGNICSNGTSIYYTKWIHNTTAFNRQL